MTVNVWTHRCKQSDSSLILLGACDSPHSVNSLLSLAIILADESGLALVHFLTWRSLQPVPRMPALKKIITGRQKMAGWVESTRRHAIVLPTFLLPYFLSFFFSLSLFFFFFFSFLFVILSEYLRLYRR